MSKRSPYASASTSAKLDTGIPRTLPMPRFDYQRSNPKGNSAEGRSIDLQEGREEKSGPFKIKALQNLRIG
jgi:hypothetical protein